MPERSTAIDPILTRFLRTEADTIFGPAQIERIVLSDSLARGGARSDCVKSIAMFSKHSGELRCRGAGRRGKAPRFPGCISVLPGSE